MIHRLTEVALPRPVRIPRSPIDEIPAPGRLARPVRADDAVLELSARRIRVGLSGTAGVRFVEADGLRLTGPVRMVGATGANLLIGPRGAQRECFTPGGAILESVQLPESLPGVVMQWARPSTSGVNPAPLTLSLDLPPEGGSVERGPPQQSSHVTSPLRFHRAPGILWLAWGETGLLVCSPGSDALPELVSHGGVIQARWSIPLPPGERAGMILQAAPSRGSWANPVALAGVTAHHRRGELAAGGSGEPGLVLGTGVSEMDDAVHWSRAWIRDRLLTPPGSTPRLHPTRITPPNAIGSGPLSGLGADLAPTFFTGNTGPAWLAMAAAAAGDREVGRAALDTLSWADPSARLLAALALARWTAWTGDTGPLVRFSELVLETFGDPSRLVGVDTGVVRVVLDQVVAAGEAARHAPLASIEPPPELPAPGRRAGRPLPMARGRNRPSAPPRLLRDGQADVSASERERESLATRELLSRVARDPGCLGAGAGALALLHLVSGMLGAHPDATFGRLTLSPLLPPHWTDFNARGIRIGDSTLDLAYRREGGSATWELGPHMGSVPVMVVFQPWQPVRGIRALRVDGAPAESEVVQETGWTRIALQLPVDRLRSVEVEGEGLSPLPSGIPLP